MGLHPILNMLSRYKIVYIMKIVMIQIAANFEQACRAIH